MKILFIEPCPVNFGGYFRAYNICLHLSKKNIKVDMLCATKAQFQYGIKKTVVNDHFSLFELPKFYFHFFLNGRILRGFLGVWYGLTGNYDIIHAAVPVQLESNIPAFFLKLLGKKVIMDWDDYWEGSSIYGEYRIMKKYVEFCEKNAPKFFQNIVVVSDFLEKLAIKRGAKRVLKLINGVNHEQFIPQTRRKSREKLKLRQDGKYLLTFGNTFINDRAYLLFKTFEAIYTRDPEIKFLFNLDPYQIIKEQNLESKINLTCLKNIQNVGYIQEQNLGYYLAACNATIFLMGDTDNERACFPIRIGSYLNGESVIIMNDVNAEVTNNLKRYNCAIIDKDIDILSEKVVNYLNHQNTIEPKIKLQVKLAKKELSWEQIIGKLINYYYNIVNE